MTPRRAHTLARSIAFLVAVLLSGSWGWLTSATGEWLACAAVWGYAASAVGGTTCGFVGLWLANTMEALAVRGLGF